MLKVCSFVNRNILAQESCHKRHHIWKSNRDWSMKLGLFLAATESALLSGCSIWTLIKTEESYLDRILLRMTVNVKLGGGGQYHQNNPLPMDQNKGQIKKTETYCTLHISSEWGCIKTSTKGTQNWGRQASLIHWLLVQLYSELYSVEFGEVGTECCFCYTQNEWTLCEHCFGRFIFKYKFVSFFWDKLHSLWYVEIEKGEETLPCSLQEVVLIISLLIWKVNQPVLLSGERVARTDLKALLSWIYIEVGKWSGCASRNVFHFDIGSLSFCFAYPGIWFQEQSSLIDLFLRMVVFMLLSC